MWYTGKLLFHSSCSNFSHIDILQHYYYPSCVNKMFLFLATAQLLSDFSWHVSVWSQYVIHCYTYMY